MRLGNPKAAKEMVRAAAGADARDRGGVALSLPRSLLRVVILRGTERDPSHAAAVRLAGSRGPQGGAGPAALPGPVPTL